MKKHLILTLLFCFNTLAQAKTLIISDIDDTIKISRIRAFRYSIVQSQLSTNVFLGMPELYELLLESQQDSELFYVSNAPTFLMADSHSLFLNTNHFPKAENLITRKNFFNSRHKRNSVISLLNKYPSNTVILIGDDGEKDPEVYQELRKELEPLGYRVHIFIRQLYTLKNIENSTKALSPVEFPIHSFISPLDLALELNQLGLLQNSAVSNIGDIVENSLNNELGVVNFLGAVIPNWADCSDYKWQVPLNSLREDQKHLPSLLLSKCR